MYNVGYTSQLCCVQKMQFALSLQQLDICISSCIVQIRTVFGMVLWFHFTELSKLLSPFHRKRATSLETNRPPSQEHATSLEMVFILTINFTKFVCL